jgi:hypothetical protein
MFVSTTIPSILNFLPRVAFREWANSTARSFRAQTVSEPITFAQRIKVVSVGRSLQVESRELPQDDRVVDESLGLLVAEVVQTLHHQHPQHDLHGRGVSPEPS